MSESEENPVTWKEMKIGGFVDHIGPLLAKRNNPGSGSDWRYGLKCKLHHANPLGIIHGGVITSLIDHAIALVAWEAADRQPVVTVQVDTKFLAAAKIGDLVEVQASLVHLTRSIIFLDAEVTVGGNPIANASAVMKVVGKKGEISNAG
ncbi:MAG: thioesterase [Hyphomicrobiales bacterium]|nr:MAG: thioesterase [Hyphomicrobiales bacterium]